MFEKSNTNFKVRALSQKAAGLRSGCATANKTWKIHLA